MTGQDAGRWRTMRRALARTVGRLAIAALARRPKRPRDFGDAPRILILCREPELGSIVAITPMLGALRRRWPSARIDVSGTALLADALRHCRHVDRIVATEDPTAGAARILIRCLASLLSPGPRYDWLITTEGTRHAPLMSVLVFCLPADRRGGLARPAAREHYDAPVPFDRDVSVIVNNLRAAAVLAIPARAMEPELYFDCAALDHARRLLTQAGLDPVQPLALFAAQTSRRQPTQWFPDRMAAVADRLAVSRGIQPVFVGTADGAGLIDEIRSLMTSQSAALAGRTGIAQLAALFALSDLAVVLDSGALHVARGVGVPAVVIASGWQSPHHWLPEAVDHCTILSRRGASCAPCHTGICATGTCMEAISAEDVIAAASTLLDRYPIQAGRRARIAAHLVESPPRRA